MQEIYKRTVWKTNEKTYMYIIQPGRKIREDRLLISIAFGKVEMGKGRKEEGKA